MVVENTLARNITVARDKAAYDAACKRLLANKVILAWIMKSCLEEYRDFDVEVIAEKYILKLLDVLLSPEKEPEEKKKILREDFHIRMTKKLEREVSELCNLSQGVFEKGEAKGEAKIIKNMYEKGFSLEQIALAADKSIKEVKAIIEGKESVLV